MDLQDLEYLPTEWLELSYQGCHILAEVVPTDHRVQLELDAVLYTPLLDIPQLRHIVPIPAPNLDIRRLVEGVTRYGQYIKVLPISHQPVLLDQTPIADNGHALQRQLLLHESTQLPDELGMQKGLAAGKVELLHAGLLEFPQAAFGVRHRGHVRVGGRVVAEAALLVA